MPLEGIRRLFYCSCIQKSSIQLPALCEAVFPPFPASFQAGIDEHCSVPRDGWNSTVRGTIFRLVVSVWSFWPLGEATVPWHLGWFISPAIPFQLKLTSPGLPLSTPQTFMINPRWTSSGWAGLCFHLASRLLNIRNPWCDPLWMYYFARENPRAALKSRGVSDGGSVGILQPSVMQSRRAALHADEASGGPRGELVS